MKIDVKECANLLLRQDNILILTHAHPDGDTLGSGFALCRALMQLGKKARVINDDVIPKKYDYLYSDIDFPEFEADYVVAVDVATENLLGGLQSSYAGKIDLCIDHHLTNTEYAKNLLLRDYPAACEIIYMLINEMGVKDQLSLKAGIFGAEPWTEDMRHQIEQSLGIKAYDVYGLTEITGPGVSYECSAQNGMHVCEDMFIPEIIDPDTEEVLPPGSFGELVFTTITKEGMPMMRYRTRDLCVLDYEKCECGRTLVRMKKPAGRTDDMLIIRGVNVFPSQIEEVLLKIGGDITPNYQIIVGRENNTDTLEVQVEMSEGLLSDDVKSVAAIEKNIIAKLRSTLGLGAKVTLVEPKTITRSEGKAKRVIDNRKLHD